MQGDGLIHRAQVVVNSKSLIGWVEQVVSEGLCSLDLLIADPIGVEDAIGVLTPEGTLPAKIKTNGKRS